MVASIFDGACFAARTAIGIKAKCPMNPPIKLVMFKYIEGSGFITFLPYNMFNHGNINIKMDEIVITRTCEIFRKYLL